MEQQFHPLPHPLRSTKMLAPAKFWEPLNISTNLAPTARYSYTAIYLHSSFMSVFMLIPGLFLLFSFGGVCTFNLMGLMRLNKYGFVGISHVETNGVGL
jgi:hypothetical protein